MIRNLRKLFGVDDGPKNGETAAGAARPSNRQIYGHSLVTHSVIGQTMVATVVENDLNTVTAPDVCYEIKELYNSSAGDGVRNIILDLENVRFVNSTGLNALVELLALVKKRQGRLGIAAATQQVEVLFKLTRLELVLTIRRTVIECIDAIEKDKIAD